MIERLLNPQQNWRTFSNYDVLDQKEIHVFKIRINQNHLKFQEEYIKVLSEEELLKAKKFARNEDSARYLLSRFASRSILACYLLTSPSEIQFHLSANKKPMVDGVEFNISHSGAYIVIAIAPGPIGIDLEYIREDFNFDNLLDDCFSVKEKQFIMKKNEERIRFYLLWTRKESLLKATGEGLTDHLNQLDCSLSSTVMRNQTNYYIKSFKIDQHHIMSVSGTNESTKFQYWDYS
ncbi:4'-phosphopantetheinyl transferase family protein [Pedobacter nutrimenti]|uniref:4'-phosphopantetheinyl transferase family protein n=1 Tax=Pedobacter nutrimenti TaxID=1241337 RepID=UPI00292E7D3C|nr:4'-phosphopantetheinyl transferase superfamily protein [Pedobacter nutrimenti]